MNRIVKIDKSDVCCPLCGRPLWAPIVEDGTRLCESCDEVFYVKEDKQ